MSDEQKTEETEREGLDYKIKALGRMHVELSDAHVLNNEQAAEIERLDAINDDLRGGKWKTNLSRESS